MIGSLASIMLYHHKDNPEWQKEVKRFISERGVDLVIEVAGATLEKWLQSYGGDVHLIGGVKAGDNQSH
jgi:hypothetical protein